MEQIPVWWGAIHSVIQRKQGRREGESNYIARRGQPVFTQDRGCGTHMDVFGVLGCFWGEISGGKMQDETPLYSEAGACFHGSAEAWLWGRLTSPSLLAEEKLEVSRAQHW